MCLLSRHDCALIKNPLQRYYFFLKPARVLVQNQRSSGAFLDNFDFVAVKKVF